MEPPWLWGGLGITWGYLKAALGDHPRYDNPEYQRYLRRFERRQLVLGKGRATRLENERIRRAGPPKAPARPSQASTSASAASSA
jgi:hypothetical protein